MERSWWLGDATVGTRRRRRREKRRAAVAVAAVSIGLREDRRRCQCIHGGGLDLGNEGAMAVSAEEIGERKEASSQRKRGALGMGIDRVKAGKEQLIGLHENRRGECWDVDRARIEKQLWSVRILHAVAYSCEVAFMHLHRPPAGAAVADPRVAALLRRQRVRVKKVAPGFGGRPLPAMLPCCAQLRSRPPPPARVAICFRTAHARRVKRRQREGATQLALAY
jgi:hypothetical protein